MRIRKCERSEWHDLLRMARELFPGLLEEDEAELRTTLGRTDAAIFVADREDGRLGGYVEVGERSIADGCATSPVGYIEAWYVDRDLRRSGLGRALLDAAEDWARKRGLREMASDALLPNDVSHAAHRRSGYSEVDRVITYRKDIAPPLAVNYVKQAVPFFWVANLQASLRFYVDGLGFVMTRQWMDEGRLQWCLLELGGASLMLQELSKDRPHRIVTSDKDKGLGVAINFICTDAVAFYRDLKSRGIDAERPFVGNAMWVTGLVDPDGYRLHFESPTDEPEETLLSDE